MKFDKNLAAIHGYLCGDGYVITNPATQKHKYYYIGLRNTNLVLLKDFQQWFKNYFGIEPRIVEGRSIIQNKDIYYELTKGFSYYSYQWEIPKLSKQNLRAWLRAFFDCEGWVENQPAKSRLIGLECVNERGIFQIKEALLKLGIASQIKKKKGRTILRLTICGKDNLVKFQTMINFLHPEKKHKLIDAVNSYQNYFWEIPGSKEELLAFIKSKGRYQVSRKEIRLLSIKKENVFNLAKALKKRAIFCVVLGPWKSSSGSQYYCLKIKEEYIHGRPTASRSSTGVKANI